MFPTVLIIDDEPSILQSLGGLLSDEGYDVLTASNGYEGLKIIEEQSPDLALLDIWMPGMDGLETLREIRSRSAATQVIIITGHGNVETAVRATKLGAFNLLEKPLNIDKVIVDINNALQFRRLEEENRFLRKKAIDKHNFTGKSPAIEQTRRQIALIAPTDSWVLILGENGTGKELAARSIHYFSKRAEEPFMDINCAAIPPDRLESELFGHEKGSVKWEAQRRRGRLEMADGGTLFLDEICDMHPDTQARLLRVLQEQRFQRVGGGREIQVNVRIIAATNRNMEKEIHAGRFREELYFRLNEIPVPLPPLRERREDIPELCRILLAETARKNGLKEKRLHPGALALLMAWQWPGNVRELKNLITRLALMTQGEEITAGDIPSIYNPEVRDRLDREARIFSGDSLAEATERFRQAFVRRKFAESGKDPVRTSRRTGLSLEEVHGFLEDKAGGEETAA